MDGLLLLNKEANMTSHDLVNVVRKSIEQKKVGHTGTLDPNATGLMILALGKATKLVSYLQTDTKEYIVEMKLGILTDTLDIWGEVLKEESFTKPSEKEFKNVLKTFIGKQKQKPPMYSAVRYKGQKLYKLARKGETVDVPLREIEIEDIELLEYNENIKLKINCSSGTYIRVICLDIAKKLNTVGVMTSLIRTKIGNFKLEEAYDINSFKKGNYELASIDKALKRYPVVHYNNISDIINGRKIEIETNHDLVLIKVDNKALAFYKREKDNLFRSKRGLW